MVCFRETILFFQTDPPTNPLVVGQFEFPQFSFVRIHKTLKVTPAMEAGVTDRLWSLEDIIKLLEDVEAAKAA